MSLLDSMGRPISVAEQQHREIEHWINMANEAEKSHFRLGAVRMFRDLWDIEWRLRQAQQKN